MQNEELNSQDLRTCQKALMALCDVVHDPENVTQTIKCGEITVVVASSHIGFFLKQCL